MFHKKIHLIWALLMGWHFATSAFAAPPDLTGSGVIAGINRTDTYNMRVSSVRPTSVFGFNQ